MDINSVIIYDKSSNNDHGSVFLRSLKTIKKARPLLFISKMFAVFGTFIIFGYYSAGIINAISSSFISLKNKTDIDQVNCQVNETAILQDHSYKPIFDPTLPEINTLNINSVGIETEILEAMSDYYEDALRKGVWRVSDFGQPDLQDMPIILVAHRFGYLNWNTPYRLKNSFYNLPKTEKGDTVEIVWMQRKYTYVIYDVGEGENITDYSADLILYTCKSMNSAEKIFRYARLIRV